ncbi:2-oxo acid dehydrogenase subunit E2 [Actinomadura sp. ATCC 31491]|uniref:2-oxo acid dehydrogenase subunit E2 n=1 Tax=Actinomadura luzonensis TaxID=2805427 RepID=A0ABT0G2X2_9ACTN|nr:2-oxo acid dehydrogenase subunit E2 [Actinomadura luzonensis]MCK2218967.1 2-oxo acid dehydrogenase subunit E2 [Actinomadura luzonensis]
MSPRLSGWRRLAMAGWRPPRDPQFYGELDLDATPLLAFQEDVRQATGVRVTMTHLAGRAVAHALAAVPELRVRLARGRLRPRESVDVFFIVATGGGHELTGLKVRDADRKPVTAVAGELSARRSRLAEGVDPELGPAKSLMARVPRWLLRPALLLSAWLTSDLDLDLSRLGLPRQPFGGAMVTSVGMWGIDRAFSPLGDFYRIPVLVLVGAVRERPVAVAGEVVARPVLTLTATFDHRYTDGFHAARFAAAVQEYCADPARFEPPIPVKTSREY